MSWEAVLAYYSDEEIERLEYAADMMSDYIEKAALDLTCVGVVDHINISELWFAVLRRREEIAKGVQAPAEAPVAPAEKEKAPESSNEAPKAEEAAESESPPAEEAPKPKPRATRAKKTD